MKITENQAKATLKIHNALKAIHQNLPTQGALLEQTIDFGCLLAVRDLLKDWDADKVDGTFLSALIVSIANAQSDVIEIMNKKGL